MLLFEFFQKYKVNPTAPQNTKPHSTKRCVRVFECYYEGNICYSLLVISEESTSFFIQNLPCVNTFARYWKELQVLYCVLSAN